MSSMPRPPNSSGTDKAVRPCSAILLRNSGERPASVSQISRSISGAASVIRKRLMASRKVSWSSVKVKSIARSLLRQTEHALGDDVALNFVGAGVDRAGLGEQKTLQPTRRVAGSRRIGQQLATGTENAHGSLVHLQIQLRPDNFIGARFGADLRATAQTADGVIGRQCVGFGAHPGLEHRIADARVTVSTVTVGLIHLHHLSCAGF